MRTHISLPEDLVKEVDELAGPRGRSKFIEEAVRLKVLNAKQRRALRDIAAMPPLDPEKYPHWRTGKDISEWVHNMRLEDQRIRDQHIEESLRDRGSLPSG